MAAANTITSAVMVGEFELAEEAAHAVEVLVEVVSDDASAARIEVLDRDAHVQLRVLLEFNDAAAVVLAKSYKEVAHPKGHTPTHLPTASEDVLDLHGVSSKTPLSLQAWSDTQLVCEPVRRGRAA